MLLVTEILTEDFSLCKYAEAVRNIHQPSFVRHLLLLPFKHFFLNWGLGGVVSDKEEKPFTNFQQGEK